MSQKLIALRNLLFSSLSQYIEALFAMVTSVIIARSLGPSGYGDYALVLWLCALGIKFTNGGVTTSLIKFVSECKVKTPEYVHGALKYCRKIQTVKLLIASVLALVFFRLLNDGLFNDISFIIFIFLLAAIIIRAYYMYYISMLKGFQEFKGNAVVMAIASPINLILVAIAAYFFKSLEAFVLIYIIVSAVYFLVSAFVVRKYCVYKKNNVELPIDLKTRIKKHSSVIMVTTLLTFLVTSESEILFLEIFASEQDLGFFKVAHRWGVTIALLLPGIFSGILLPLMSSSVAMSRDVVASRFLSSFKYVAILAFPAALFLFLYSNKIINILYGTDYNEAVTPFMIIAVTCCLTSFSSIASSYLLSTDKQSVILKIIILATGIKLLLGYFFVVNYQLIGAAISFALSNLFIFFAILIYSLKQLDIKLPFYHFAKVITSAVTASLFCMFLPSSMHDVLFMFFATIIFSSVYLFFTLVMKCWAKEELDYAIKILDSMEIALLSPLMKLLKWSAS